MYSLVREERYEPFALECHSLGERRSCNSLAGCKLFKLFGLAEYSCLSFSSPLAQELSSFLLSYHNLIRSGPPKIPFLSNQLISSAKTYDLH